MLTRASSSRTGAGSGITLLVLTLSLVACGDRRATGAFDEEANAPVTVGSGTIPAEQIRSYLAENTGYTSRGGRVFCGYVVLGQDNDRVYLNTVCEELLASADTTESGSGRGGPVELQIDTTSTPPRIVGHRLPGDGSLHGRDVREIFPETIQRRIQDSEEHNRWVEAIREANRTSASEAYSQ